MTAVRAVISPIALYVSLPIEAIFSREPFAPMSDKLYGTERPKLAKAR